MNKALGPRMGYGPIETIVFNLDKGLHALGHGSIVACSSDSEVTGEKYETVPATLGDYVSAGSSRAQAHVELHLSRALERAKRGDVDIVHMHEWFEHVCLGTFNPRVPVVMTLHVPGANSGVAEFCERNPQTSFPTSMHFVAISEFQRRQYAGVLPVVETIHHGIDADEYPAADAPSAGGYLLSIGRVTEVKGQDTAIAVARRTGTKLILAGCVQNKAEDRAFFSRLSESIDVAVDVSRYPVGADYYDEVMKPILSSDKQIIYVGELGGAAKKHWYRHARATLFPIRWGEPFGMVLIESMAAGTPVVAFREGAVAEIVKHDETGFVVDSVDAMVEAVGHIDRIDRARCRAHVAAQFSVRRMASAYAALYADLAGSTSRASALVEKRGLQLPVRARLAVG
jgi:glycosyltransferase involved in cell wall biosynthesis